MSKSTMVELVQELERINIDGKYDYIIAEAKAGEFHDFKNSKHAAPKIELVRQLQKFAELEAYAEAVMQGEYDEDYN